MRDLVDDVRTKISEHENLIFVPNLYPPLDSLFYFVISAMPTTDTNTACGLSQDGEEEA